VFTLSHPSAAAGVGLAVVGLVGACSFARSSPPQPTSAPSTTQATAPSPTAAASSRPAPGLLPIEVPDNEGTPLRESGSGPASIAVPQAMDGHAVRAITVYVICAPAGAAFEVRLAGVRKFWGACAAQSSPVAGEFTIGGADRQLTIQIGPTSPWSLAVTRSG
jgi:hypothetical protein